MLANDNQLQQKIQSVIADAIAARSSQVAATIELLDSGATVPFIARYRKEMTGGLTDTQLRTLEERLSYLRELEARRVSIRDSIESQGKLDAALAGRIDTAATKSELEDLYLPFRQKRKTKGVLAAEAGLQPLAELLWSGATIPPEAAALDYLNADKGFSDAKSVLDGAKYLLMERFAEDATLIAKLRNVLVEQSFLCSTLMKGKEKEAEKFQDYFDFQEKLSAIPSHRALAMFRGRSEGFLSLALKLKEAEGDFGTTACINTIASHTGFSHQGAVADDWRQSVVDWTWKVKLSTHLENDLFLSLREKADAEAIRVFADNLRDLLLAAPAGARTTMGLDPGYRSGVKVAVTDATGKVVSHTTIYPHAPQKQWNKAVTELSRLCQQHRVELIAIGNGTASRETDKLAADVIKQIETRKPEKIVISEAGASVYSASQIAENEFPDLDVTIRGAVSIARRLQDPLAELVKIDPKAIGVGQYQHDVSQTALAKSLDATVEDCVNGVGVDLNTASAALLNRVAGINSTIAENIVQHRNDQGPFQERKALNKVARLGPKAFEQCAGFLRIIGGKNPLDASGVHPEAYPLVKNIVKHCKKDLSDLIGDRSTLGTLPAEAFTTDKFGLPTVKDILAELEKPGRDPRPEFKAARFSEGIDSITDLSLNQVLEGQVTNVTNFGAFVDIGVHQDGLVHIASMSEQFVKDPRQVVKTGDIVKVKVMSVDPARNRIGLSMRLSDDAEAEGGRGRSRSNSGKPPSRQRPSGGNKPASRKQNASDNAPSALALALQASLDKNKD
ncbi:MAG: Tex family protein [Granulosicoccus sp.]